MQLPPCCLALAPLTLTSHPHCTTPHGSAANHTHSGFVDERGTLARSAPPLTALPLVLIVIYPVTVCLWAWYTLLPALYHATEFAFVLCARRAAGRLAARKLAGDREELCCGWMGQDRS
ncbi:hypothetical protein DFH08DRAFT_824237 [Mycena albidolilacea]|uniref:Uncharacterized protein n=1 Tax=Mycena albidolilacea TaxID=1033008 RepID=A0AAD6Z532_9AGAR|nr:hypothetical protein DFH08DRAFT_824237 [Mycena albidolilacea]